MTTFRVCLVILSLLLLSDRPQAQQGSAPAHLKPGLTLLQNQEFVKAAAAFEAIVKEDPEDGAAWYHLGYSLHAAGELDLAVRAHLLSTQFLSPNDARLVAANYNVACVYALKGKTERALQWLHRARNLGFADFALIGRDTDLDLLRKDPRFVDFLASGPLKSPVDSSVVVKSVTKVMTGGSGGVEVGDDGTLYVANFGSDLWTIESDGSWKVHATGFTKAADCTLDRKGNLLQVDFGASQVWRIAPDGTKTDLAVKGLSGPVGIALAAGDDFYLTNFNKNAILRVDSAGNSEVVAAGGPMNGPNGLANAGEHGLFIANYNDGKIIHLDPETGKLRLICVLPGGGNGHLAWTGEELIVTARKGHRLYRVTPQGGFQPLAGSGAQGIQDGGAVTSSFSLPNGVALSADMRTVFFNNALSGNRSVVTRLELGDS